jgi:hypothetical protein
MKHLPSRLAGLLFAFNISVAVAAPQIPSSELPGRERYRFMESPVERFMRPSPQQQPYVIEFPGKRDCGVRPGSAKLRSEWRKTCQRR